MASYFVIFLSNWRGLADKTMNVSIRMLVDTVHATKLSVELSNQ